MRTGLKATRSRARMHRAIKPTEQSVRAYGLMREQIQAEIQREKEQEMTNQSTCIVCGKAADLDTYRNFDASSLVQIDSPLCVRCATDAVNIGEILMRADRR